MEVGIITSLRAGEHSFENVRNLGLNVCQLSAWEPELASEANAARVIAESAETGVRVCAVWAGVPGPRVWDFKQGPVTLGLVPPEYRQERVNALKKWADFAKWIGAPAIITHCGFIPENMTDPQYDPVVRAIADVAEHCARLGLEFWFETGQETPVVLLRTIQRAGTGNFGINLDPANLILYGKSNPIDALDVIGPYVRNIHAKDGFYPTDGDFLGQEVPVGQGKVDFPRLVARLKELNFKGEWIIEREGRITEEARRRDILQTVDYLRNLVG